MSSEHRRRLPRLELPCLAFHHCDRSTTLLSMSGHKLIDARDANELLRNKVICPTAQGFLLVRDPDNEATFLWNPLDGDKVLLPHLAGVDDTVLMDSNCLLSDKPSAPGCTVVLVESSENTLIWYCHPGDNQWVKYEYDIGSHVLPCPDEEDQYEKIAICTIAACKSKLYFNCTATELCVIDFNGGAEPVLSTIKVDDTIATDGSYGYKSRPGLAFLVESDGDLFMIRLLFALPREGEDKIEKVTVHRMDFSVLRWRNMDDLGGRSFLLSRLYFGTSCSGGERGLRSDCIYFVCPLSNSLQVFDLKQGTCQLHKLDAAPVVDSAFWLFPTSP
ncbi:hypothetical protein QOZ80_1AG0043320 [Eleusine coracana subsp. coracana]|nr:hypothetical protein QOZ80_1AG0043320 [Eleusine coracana subsp. coracana]